MTESAAIYVSLDESPLPLGALTREFRNWLTGLTLMQNASGVTIHGGWPSERWFANFAKSILAIQIQSHPFYSDTYTHGFNAMGPK